MKTCPKCKTPKLNTDYYKSKQKKCGLEVWCKTCMKALSIKNYRAKSAAYQKAVNALWYYAKRHNGNFATQTLKEMGEIAGGLIEPEDTVSP